ncbi:MAG TPA: HlyD family efflux transporter periplasmic adaptor subunit [Ruminiclostridium sp.]|nr:HlyD family efflux transporter periplasmic adaptor subunit [Ruminiclostridium sp.]
MSTKAKNKKGKKIITWVSVLLVVLIVGVVAIPGVVHAKNNQKTVQGSMQTRTITVGTQNITKSVTGTGEIVTGDQETLDSDTDKTVDTVSVSGGQVVKKGAVLIKYTDGTEMTAPFDGIISTVTIPGSTGGKTVTAGDSIVIMSTDTFEIQLPIDETDLQNIKVGQKANVTVNAYPNTKYTGTVTSIADTGTYNNGSSKFNINIKLDQITNLRIGMSADVDIIVKSVTGAVAVPIDAVRGSGDNASVVLVNSDGTTAPTQVKLGLANDAYVQIVSGLSVGDTIQYNIPVSNSNTRNFSGLGGGAMFGRNAGNRSSLGGGANRLGN